MIEGTYRTYRYSKIEKARKYGVKGVKYVSARWSANYLK
jgi:hypothetical protein